MKSIEDIKQEIKALINEAADQGVLIEQISGFFVGTLAGRGVVTHIELRETRRK